MVDRRHSANKRDTGALVTRLDSSECRFRDVSETISSFCGTQTYSPASPFGAHDCWEWSILLPRAYSRRIIR